MKQHIPERVVGTMRMTYINLQERPASCWACGGDATGLQFGIPVYEDIVLPNNWEGLWGGVPACNVCFDKQNQLTAPVALAAFQKD